MKFGCQVPPAETLTSSSMNCITTRSTASAEFIELYNNSATESVDLSGWTIDGVGLRIAYGTVILPGESVVFTDDFATFRAQSPGDIFVGGQSSGGLSGGGELITLSDAVGNLIDSVEYDDVAPLRPAEPDGNGFALALINRTLDNSLASSWSASDQSTALPGRPNDSQVVATLVKIYAGRIVGRRNCDLPSRRSTSRHL